MRSPVRSVVRSTVTARCVERHMAPRFVVAQASGQVTSAGRKAQNSSPFTSLRPATIEDSAVSAVRLFSAASISSRRFTDYRLVHWTTTRASSRSGTFSLRTRPHGMRSRMNYRSFRSFRRKLPDSAMYSDTSSAPLRTPVSARNRGRRRREMHSGGGHECCPR